MQKHRDVLQQASRLAVAVALCIAAMLAVYALTGHFTNAVLLGALIGFVMAMGNFLSLSITVSNAMNRAANGGSPQKAQLEIQTSSVVRPVILVITAEHIGHQVVTSKIVGRDLLKEPGLHRSLLGDNLSTAFSGLFGSVPTTTYGENIGVMAVTGVYSVQVIAGAAVISILMAFIGPLSAFIATIPGDVIGGITFLLYGMIGTSGLRILVDKKVDYGKNRNLILTSVVFVAGLSGLTLTFGAVSITGMTLAAVTAVILLDTQPPCPLERERERLGALFFSMTASRGRLVLREGPWYNRDHK